MWIPESALHERISRRQQTPPQLAWRREARVAVMCLVCQAPMETLVLYDVPVDRCKGHGIWLDGGELEGVLEHCTRARRQNESHALDTLGVVGDVAIGTAEVAIEGAFVAADIAGRAVSGLASAPTAGGDPTIPVTAGAAGAPGATGASDVDVPVPTAALGVGAAAHAGDPSPLAEALPSADTFVDGGDATAGALDSAGGVVEAAAEGGGGALEVVGDVVGTVADGAVTVVGAVASGSVTVVTTIVEGLLDGLGSILDF